MLCEICYKHEATIKLTQVINQKKKEINICKRCSEEKGFSNPLVNLQKFFGSLLFLTQFENEKITDDIATVDLCCNNCGMSWQSFHQKGLLGCKNCYTAFSDKLNILIRRIHGSTKHIGNRPASQRVELDENDIDVLKKDLEAALIVENYEYAAQLRDRIRDIEANLKRMKK